MFCYEFKKKIIGSIGEMILTFNFLATTPITSRLQRKVNWSWQTVDAWTESSTSTICRLKKTKLVNKEYEYRVFSTMKAYTASDSESIVVYSSVVKH